MWMSGGLSFVKRSGTESGTDLQDMAPEDVGLAHAQGWVPAADPTEPDEDYKPDLGNATAGV